MTKGADTPAQKLAQAKKQAADAIDNYCARYLTSPVVGTLRKDAEAKFSLHKETYNLYKDNALSISADIGTVTHKGKKLDESGEKAVEVMQDINDWFSYCDTVFDEYKEILAQAREEQRQQEESELAQPLAEEPVGEMAAGEKEPESATEEPPPDVKEEPAGTGEGDTAMATEGGEAASADEVAGSAENTESAGEDTGEDEEYKEWLGQASGARLGILKKEGRVPDFADNDDNPLQAKVWQYESDDGSSCRQYNFKNNKATAKKLKGECPL